VDFVESLEALEMIAAAGGSSGEGTDGEGDGATPPSLAEAGGAEGAVEETRIGGGGGCESGEVGAARAGTATAGDVRPTGDEECGGGAVATTVTVAGFERTLAQLRLGEREGKMSQFPALPDTRVHWVADAAAVLRMRAAVFADQRDGSTGQNDPHGIALSMQVEKEADEDAKGGVGYAEDPKGGVGDAEDAKGGVGHAEDAKAAAAATAAAAACIAGHGLPHVIGLDAEWRPQSGTPVAVLQV
jgi:hypothetical protein